jgi:hypothetical protein
VHLELGGYRPNRFVEPSTSVLVPREDDAECLVEFGGEGGDAGGGGDDSSYK